MLWLPAALRAASASCLLRFLVVFFLGRVGRLFFMAEFGSWITESVDTSPIEDKFKYDLNYVKKISGFII